MAVAADIRPGAQPSGTGARSRKTAWSISRSRPDTYSPRVAAAMATTARAHRRATYRRRQLSSARCSHHSPHPARAKHSAVLNFIVARPGRALFSNAMSAAQPIMTTPPSAIVRTLAPAGRWRNHGTGDRQRVERMQPTV